MFSKNKKAAGDEEELLGIGEENAGQGSSSGIDSAAPDGPLDEFIDGQPSAKPGDYVTIPNSKILLIRKLLRTIRESEEQIENLLSAGVPAEDLDRISLGQISDFSAERPSEYYGQEKVIEGVFDGERMVGPDGKQYTVPSNYASKSKLVEGDLMKLTITPNGTFLYKQIGPIDRSRVVGALAKDEDGNYHVESNGKHWRVLTASVTYFRGENGDEAVILIPKNGDSKWAAIENIIKR